jgi:hypothetical protein
MAGIAVSRVGALERTRTAMRRGLGGGRWRAGTLIAVGALVRLGLVVAGWPRTDSDEATMGLMALHIATRGELPLFFCGQVYMGTLQAYLGALLFPIFGVSVVTLRLGLVLLFLLFALVMYALARLLYGQAFALVTLGLLALGGPDLLKAQLLALGGYPETLLFGALSLLLAVWLAMSPADGGDGRPRRRRLAAYAGLGVAMGLGWWSDPLVAPFLLAPLPLLAFRRRELRWRGLAALAVGLLVGLAPQIAFMLTRLNAGGPSVVAAFQPRGVATLAQLPAHLFTQIAGTLFISLPNITGAGWVCSLPVSPRGLFVGWSGMGLLACAGLRLGWSLGFLALGVVAARVAWRDLRAAKSQRAAARQVGRLSLLLGGALALALYASSPQAATPLGNARYLIGLLIALPAVVYPLWAAAVAGLSRRRAWNLAALGLVALAMAGGVAATYAQAPDARADAAASQALVRDLERLGVRHMYTDYWTCYKVAFLSRERITCDVLDAALGQGNNRYTPYVAAVQADPRAAYVFPDGSPQAAALARRAADPTWGYAMTRLDGYVIYTRQR